MTRVGIVGCGKIADQHANHIKWIPDSELVAVCDREPLMARQLADRFRVPGLYEDLAEMLRKARLDVIHVTTPPHSHFELGRQCLEAGVHVYIEKPFTVDAKEAESLINLAEQKSLKLTAGHNVQFSQESRAMRALVSQGFLGGAPSHMESLYCYDLRDSYAEAFLRDGSHWLRRLPGNLLHNLISHGISKIAEFFPDDRPRVLSHAFVSPLLESKGERQMTDELRTIIYGDSGTTAYFTFSSGIRPRQNHFRLYGPRNSLIVDQVHQTVIKVPSRSYKAQLNYLFPPLGYSRQYRRSSMRNMKQFLKRDLHMDSGMRYLIQSFYRSANENSRPPIPYREILLVSTIMDEIFRQLT